MVAVSLRQHGLPAGRRRGGDVALAVGVGHVLVAAGVQAEHRDGQRHGGQRVGQPVLVRPFTGGAAHQVKRRGAADAFPRAVGQRQHARLGDDPRHLHPRARPRRPGREFHPARRPGREVPARAVPDRDHPGGIHRQRREQVDPGRNILERPRPAPSGQRPPVLQVPRRVPARRQVLRQRPPERPVEPRPPEPPVDDHHRPGRRPVRPPRLTELSRIRPVPVDSRPLHRRISRHRSSSSSSSL